jgi:hypothetical protein
MARYKLTNTTCIGGALCAAGAEVDYAGWPGSTLDPLDDEAREIKAYYDEAREAGRNLPKAPSDWRAAQAKAAALAAPAPPAADPDPVAIPPDWADQRPEQIINLARRLGAPVRGTNARAAVKFIEAQIKARADHDAADDEGAE